MKKPVKEAMKKFVIKLAAHRIVIILGLIAVSSLYAQAEDATILPPKDGIGTRPSDESVRVIGNLPYSNQWVFERPNNYLYLTTDSATLSSKNIYVSHFASQYSKQNLGIVAVDFFSRILDFADPAGTSAWRRLSLWGRYKFGYGSTDGTLNDTETSAILGAEKSTLMLFTGQIELNLTYDWKTWLQPYVGFCYRPFYYRNSSSMPGAESEGRGSTYGPTLGVHLPILFSHRGTILAEVRQDIVETASDKLLSNQTTGDFGFGLAF